MLVAGCVNADKKDLQSTNQTKGEKQIQEIGNQEELEQLLGHSAYIIGAILSGNYAGEIGDIILWQDGRRHHLRLDYVKFHKLADDELLDPNFDYDNPLRQIDDAYLKAITTMEMKQLENGDWQTDREGLKESFGPFCEFLTEETFKKYYYNKRNAEERFERFKEFAKNGFILGKY